MYTVLFWVSEQRILFFFDLVDVLQHYLMHQLVIPPKFTSHQRSQDDELACKNYPVVEHSSFLILASFEFLNRDMRQVRGEHANLIDFCDLQVSTLHEMGNCRTNLLGRFHIDREGRRPDIRIDGCYKLFERSPENSM